MDRYPLGSATENNTPEKIPEFGVLVSMIALTVVSLAVFRRRR